ncbi:MAG: hypothetical protein ACRDZU_06895 [Acidimicrobiales bacterium]
MARRVAGVTVAVLLVGLLGACSGGGGGLPDQLAEDDDAPNPGPLPTLPGGVELPALDPARVLVGAGLAFGTPLPSDQVAADAFTVDPEVSLAVPRRVFAAADGRRLGDALVLVLDGSELFDTSALVAFERAAVASLGGGRVRDIDLDGRVVLRSSAADHVALGFREGNLLTIVTGPVEGDVQLAVSRQLQAIARGEVGAPSPVTPLIAIGTGSAFIPMATVSFEPIPPAEEEPGPEVPAFPGSTSVEGRYGVVAGERRTVVWVFALDLGMYPSAEALAPALPGLVAARADGTEPQALEVIDRFVLASTNPDGAPSARVFRHQGLVLLVEGDRASQLDAVVSAWITALGPG